MNMSITRATPLANSNQSEPQPDASGARSAGDDFAAFFIVSAPVGVPIPSGEAGSPSPEQAQTEVNGVLSSDGNSPAAPTRPELLVAQTKPFSQAFPIKAPFPEIDSAKLGSATTSVFGGSTAATSEVPTIPGGTEGAVRHNAFDIPADLALKPTDGSGDTEIPLSRDVEVSLDNAAGFPSGPSSPFEASAKFPFRPSGAFPISLSQISKAVGSGAPAKATAGSPEQSPETPVDVTNVVRFSSDAASVPPLSSQVSEAGVSTPDLKNSARPEGGEQSSAPLPQQIEPKVIDLANALRLEHKGDRKMLRLHLHPAELGSVEITVERHESGMVSTRIVAENERASASLNENLLQLRDALEKAGLQVDRVEVSFRPPSSSTMGQGGNQEQPSGRRTDSHQPAGIEDRGGIAEVRGDDEDRLVSLRA
jgi:hypothetical protein